MYYTVYKITNLLNNKIYIGKHQTENLDDGYMGSGKHLIRAQTKYGKENFKKEILFVFGTEQEMNAKESELVTEEFCSREDTYNICVGGKGGFSYINENKLNISDNQKRVAAIYARKNLEKINSPEMYSAKMRALEKANETRKNLNLPGSFLGKKHTEETKQKMSASHNGRHVGQKNSQYGTMWITNGSLNKKVKRDVVIPEGWFAGRS